MYQSNSDRNIWKRREREQELRRTEARKDRGEEGGRERRRELQRKEIRITQRSRSILKSMTEVGASNG